MTLLDAYGLVALVADEPAAVDVERLLRRGDCRIVIANLAEAIDVVQRVHRVPADDVRAAIEPLLLGRRLATAVSDEPEAWLGAHLRARHYERRSRALSLADCLLLAHALRHGDAIATADPPVAEVAREEGVDLIPLPNSSGERPSRFTGRAARATAG